jgi:hypothetical protein
MVKTISRTGNFSVEKMLTSKVLAVNKYLVR